ncbi:HAAS signaling domain-containing protein [Pseudonocardia sp. TRM90224]|uniref:HAAS signaling domain-containing protein n=1 Tax=Pseudonocardia sp. TRM90224 TaxID=2812678 RepID=UPI001E475578|nr:hypothetical protein [Pseudonocardia sp. TRM90224]
MSDQEKKQESAGPTAAKGEEAVPTTMPITEAPTVKVARPAVEDYLAGIRGELADLPATEVSEILDDVGAHLSELAAELGEGADTAALTARLGSPSAYAAELRAAAGYPPKPAAQAAPASSTPARLALIGLLVSTVGMTLGTLAFEPAFVLLCALAVLLAVPLLTRDGPRVPSVAALPAVQNFLNARPKVGSTWRSSTDFVASLQPAWWLLRAFVAAGLVFAVFGTSTGLTAVLLLFLVVAPVSVLLGFASRRDRRWLWAVVPLNGVAAAAMLLVAGSGLASPVQEYSSPASYSQPGLWLDGAREIEDIRPVDAQGQPLSDIYLFDQNGQAIDVSSQRCYEDGRSSYAPSVAPRPYPRGTSQFDPTTGECRHVPPAPLVVAVPQPTAQPTATPMTAPPSMSVAPQPTTAPPASGPPVTTVKPPPTTG